MKYLVVVNKERDEKHSFDVHEYDVEDGYAGSMSVDEHVIFMLGLKSKNVILCLPKYIAMSVVTAILTYNTNLTQQCRHDTKPLSSLESLIIEAAKQGCDVG